MVRRALHTEVAPNLEQRENLFHTRCKIGLYLCTLIVDSGSCTNVASQELVRRLKLTQRDHARPYKLNWLDDSKGIEVKKQTLVTFEIGKYLDELWCDVVPMSAWQLLLGRPWQFDRKVKHDGEANVYSILMGNKRIDLLPLSPKAEVKPKTVKQPMKPRLFLSAKEAEREIDQGNPTFLLMVKEVSKDTKCRTEDSRTCCGSMGMCFRMSCRTCYHLSEG